MRGSVLRASVACAVVMVWGVLAPGTAAAHAELTGSSPSDGAVLASPPPGVELTFSEPLQPSFTTVAVSDGAGRQVPAAPPAVAGNRVTVAFPRNASGEYTVAFRVLSQDGHSVSDAIKFSVQQLPPSPASPAPESPPSATAPAPTGVESDDGGASGVWWLVGVAAAGLVIGGAVFAALRRPGESSDD